MLFLSLLLSVPIYYTYAALGSAMPRAGGDYLYETRTLLPVVGFTVPWACQLLFWLTFPVAGAFVVGTFGLASIAEALGASDLSRWLGTSNGTFVVAACVVVACWLLTVYGLRLYRPLQRWVLVPAIVLATLIIYGVLLANLGTDFADKFNAFHDQRITVAKVLQSASANGFSPPSLSLEHTVIWIAVLTGFTPYTMYAAQGLLGEVRQARNLRKLFLSFLLPGIFVTVIMLAIPYWLLSHIAGGDFLSAYASAYYNEAIAPDYSPNFSVFLSMLSDNTALTVLIALGFVAGGFGIANVVFVNSARVMMAMGLDGSLPTFFGDVSRRFNTPVKASTLWSVCALSIAAVFSYRPGWEFTVILGGLVTSGIVVGVTCVAGAVFPYRAPDLYRSSPTARHVIGGIPLITIAGAVAGGLIGLLIWVALSFDELALTSRDSRLVVAGSFVTGLAAYIALRVWRRKQGIDIDLAFREVPPD
jgi:amino acid transporter